MKKPSIKNPSIKSQRSLIKPKKPKKPKKTNRKQHKLTNQLLVNQGSPDSVISKPQHGLIYVDELSADSFIYVSNLGWVQLNGWCPDAGEDPPSSENPINPISGDQYINVLTGDFYYFVEGFGWISLTGVEGPRGEPGPTGDPGFADLFYTIAKKQELKNEFSQIKWLNIPEFEDNDYQLEDTIIKINPQLTDPIRYEIKVKISIEDSYDQLDLFEFRIKEGDQIIPGSLTYGCLPVGVYKVSISLGGIIEVIGESQVSLEGKITSNGEIKVMEDSYFMIIRLG